jgi:hypothetical protein
MHLALLAAAGGAADINHVVLANGLPPEDVAWLRKQMPDITVVSLQSSLSANTRTFLAHSEVIRLCALAAQEDFAIQDADSFVIDESWWSKLKIPSTDCYAAGPFSKPINGMNTRMPDTYLVALNGRSLRKSEAMGIGAEITSTPTRWVAEALRKRGLPSRYFPDGDKRYFDTLQVHWVAAVLQGQKFHQIGGAGEVVFHVGGTSYLNNSQSIALDHWEYWPLNTAYFTLRLIESPRFQYVRGRFSHLVDRFRSAEAILADYPGFSGSRRHLESELILKHYSHLIETSG